MGEGPEHNPFAPPAEYADFSLRPVAYDSWHLATYWQRFAGAFVDNLFLVLTTIPGVLVGSRLGVRLPERALRPTLGVVLLVSGLKLL